MFSALSLGIWCSRNIHRTVQQDEVPKLQYHIMLYMQGGDCGIRPFRQRMCPLSFGRYLRPLISIVCHQPPPYTGREDLNKCALWDPVEQRHTEEVRQTTLCIAPYAYEGNASGSQGSSQSSRGV